MPPIVFVRNVKQTGKITGLDKGEADVFLGTAPEMKDVAGICTEPFWGQR